LARRDCYFIVCLVDTTPVGYLSAYRFPEVESASFFVYLFDIIVDERFRRKGIGSRMIEELKKQCREDQVGWIEVGTAVENQAAQRTYEGTGARKVETCVGYLYLLNEEG
jgi:ribosomal protein S18 acetylase RimI-like enzyme